MRSQGRAAQQRMLARFHAMHVAYQHMPEAAREELYAWERINLDGRLIGTSDWPGWERFIANWPAVPSMPKPKPERRKSLIPPALRWEVWERDNFTCRQCGARRFLTCDHIVPESLGGPTTLANLQTLCERCNCRKGARP